MAKRFHPDLHATKPEDMEWASKIFTLLGNYRDELIDSIKKGGITPGEVEFTIAIGKREISFTDIIHEGDLGLVLRNGSDVLKVVRDPADSDLFRNAENNLRKLRGDKHFDRYLPGKITPVNVNIGGTIHSGQHYKYVKGYTLEQVKERYEVTTAPHSTWMLNRILEVLCHAHSKGICLMVNGASLDDAVSVAKNKESTSTALSHLESSGTVVARASGSGTASSLAKRGSKGTRRL